MTQITINIRQQTPTCNLICQKQKIHHVCIGMSWHLIFSAQLLVKKLADPHRLGRHFVVFRPEILATLNKASCLKVMPISNHDQYLIHTLAYCLTTAQYMSQSNFVYPFCLLPGLFYSHMSSYPLPRI